MKRLLLAVMAICSGVAIGPSVWAQTPDSKEQFEEFYSKFQAKVFQGRAQGLSAFNLDLQMIIHYEDSLNADGGKKFSLASNGNMEINGAPVFPVSGQVVYEVKDSSGQLQKFLVDGEEVTLSRQPFTMYLVESDLAYSNRIQRLQSLSGSLKDARFEKAAGRMIAVVKFDVQKQNIRFFQLDAQRNLIPSGVFDGSVTVPRASYF